MVQVGRSSHVRDELLARFRARGLEMLALIAVAAVAGGFLLTRAALAPLRALEGTVRSILQTGQFDARVPIRNSHDPLDELGARVNEMLERIQSLIGGMRGAHRQRRARSADAADAFPQRGGRRRCWPATPSARAKGWRRRSRRRTA